MAAGPGAAREGQLTPLYAPLVAEKRPLWTPSNCFGCPPSVRPSVRPLCVSNCLLSLTSCVSRFQAAVCQRNRAFPCVSVDVLPLPLFIVILYSKLCLCLHCGLINQGWVRVCCICPWLPVCVCVCVHMRMCVWLWWEREAERESLFPSGVSLHLNENDLALLMTATSNMRAISGKN